MEKAVGKKNGVNVKKLVLDNKALLILIILVLGISIGTKGLFIQQTNVLNVIRQVCASITLGCGFTLILAAGGIDLSVGAMVSLIGIWSAQLSLIDSLPFAVVLILTILIGIGVGAFNGLVVNGLGLPAFVVTIGTKSIFEGITAIVSNNQSVIGIPDAYRFIGQGYVFGSLKVPFTIFIMLFMVILTWFIINKTRFGRFCLATGGNAEAARACGVNVKKISTLSYVWMGACASITAMIMTGRSASGQVGAGSGMEMDIIAGVVMGGTSMTGGVARVVGTVFGCLMIGVINNGLNLLQVDANWQKVAKGLLILIAIFLDAYGAKLLAKRSRGK